MLIFRISFILLFLNILILSESISLGKIAKSAAGKLKKEVQDNKDDLLAGRLDKVKDKLINKVKDKIEQKLMSKAKALIPKTALNKLAKKCDSISICKNNHKAFVNILKDVGSALKLKFEENGKLDLDDVGDAFKQVGQERLDNLVDKMKKKAVEKVIDKYNKNFGDKFNQGLKRSIQRIARENILTPAQSQELQEKLEKYQGKIEKFQDKLENYQDKVEKFEDKLGQYQDKFEHAYNFFVTLSGQTEEDITQQLYDFASSNINNHRQIAGAIKSSMDKINTGVHGLASIAGVNLNGIHQAKLRLIGR